MREQSAAHDGRTLAKDPGINDFNWLAIPAQIDVLWNRGRD